MWFSRLPENSLSDHVCSLSVQAQSSLMLEAFLESVALDASLLFRGISLSLTLQASWGRICGDAFSSEAEK